ncbi:DUF6527 family protein [Wenyingzhuangia sp. IMCC45533]
MLSKLLKWFKILFVKRRTYRLEYVKQSPEFLKDNIVYVECNIDKFEYWYVVFKCPCGCKEQIVLNLFKDVKPNWDLKKDKKYFSIYPSVFRTVNCKSHFWMKKNKIVWCK